MQFVNLGIGVTFLALAVMHLLGTEAAIHWSCVFTFAASATLAFLTLTPELSRPVARGLAIVTAVVAFFYFAGFFRMVPQFGDDWYRSSLALDAVSLLLAAFAMLPVLSDYSCRLKADCREKRRHHGWRGAFFSVPSHIEESRHG